MRQLDWQQIIKDSWLIREAPIALLDAHVLGSNIPARAKASLLGRALKIDHQLDPIERAILAEMKGRSSVHDLIKTFCDMDLDEQSVINAARSLLRRQLVRIGSTLANVR
jgi:hypothetical protein